MIAHEKIHEFNILVFNNGVKENKESMLENNLKIRELVENSPFVDNNDVILDKLFLLT